MKYRNNKRTGDKISEIGMGSAYIYEAGTKVAVDTIRHAYEGGVNYFDLAAGDGSAFPMYGEALSDVRDKIFYQIHFGADYSRGTYGWSLDLDTVKRSLDKQLHDLKTDYINYGFIHCQDEFSDWESYQRNGVYDYILKLRDEGVVKHLGLSSHTPAVIQKIMDDARIDMLMFSVNPGYDYGQGDYAHGGVDERTEVYKKQAISLYELDKSEPKHTHLKLIAGALDVPVSLLIGEISEGISEMAPGMHSEEAEIIVLLRQMSPEVREVALEQIRALRKLCL